MNQIKFNQSSRDLKHRELTLHGIVISLEYLGGFAIKLYSLHSFVVQGVRKVNSLDMEVLTAVSGPPVFSIKTPNTAEAEQPNYLRNEDTYLKQAC